MDVKTLCLGVLSSGACSGYEIRKAFEEGPFSHFQDAGYGSIYPALKRLTEDGLVVCSEMQQESRPDKKVYRITASGRQALFDAVNKPPTPDRLRSDFLFILSFAELVTPRHLDRLIEDRIAHHREELARMEECSASPAGPAFVLKFGTAWHRAALEFLETHQHELVGSQLQKDVAE